MSPLVPAEKLPITVVILTKDEATVVARAIASARDAFDEVAVLDSFSADDTVRISQEAGASVHQNAFEGYASQRNFALHRMPKRNDWVLFLDADEEVSPELAEELRRDFGRLRQDGVGLVYMRRKDYFMGRWIRRSSGYPTWFGRLCHAPSVSITREINEEYHCAGATARLGEHLIHHPFAKGVVHWVDRHNRYSTAEAREKGLASRASPGELWSRDPGLRRRAMKQVYMRLPLRPVVGFAYLYLARGGFLDGRPGLHYAVLRAFYEFLIDLKAREMQAATREGRP